MVTNKTCKCCGQTLPELEGIEVTLSAGLRNIVAIVRRAGKYGIATDRLFDLVYGDDPDGGPDTGHKVLHARICAANKVLRQNGWEMTGEHTGNTRIYGNYVLQQIMPSDDRRRTRCRSVMTSTPAS